MTAKVLVYVDEFDQWVREPTEEEVAAFAALYGPGLHDSASVRTYTQTLLRELLPDVNPTDPKMRHALAAMSLGIRYAARLV